MLEDSAVRRAVVFSHPNHEITVYGFLRRHRPPIVYLTDGGGPHRVAQTREGLAAIGCLDRAVFLDHTEQSFYDALLARDAGLYLEVADEVRAALRPHDPEQVLCDAVELYNPVHDMALPVVRAALGRGESPAVVEVPLVWERTGTADSYVVQRVPESRRRDAVRFRLSEAEIDAKDRARRGIYTLLREQMGGLVCDAPREALAFEEAMPAREEWTAPGGDVGLRYERRGRRLLDRGEVSRVITYADHWRPVATALAGDPVSERSRGDPVVAEQRTNIFRQRNH